MLSYRPSSIIKILLTNIRAQCSRPQLRDLEIRHQVRKNPRTIKMVAFNTGLPLEHLRQRSRPLDLPSKKEAQELKSKIIKISVSKERIHLMDSTRHSRDFHT